LPERRKWFGVLEKNKTKVGFLGGGGVLDEFITGSSDWHESTEIVDVHERRFSSVALLKNLTTGDRTETEIIT